MSKREIFNSQVSADRQWQGLCTIYHGGQNYRNMGDLQWCILFLFLLIIIYRVDQEFLLILCPSL